MPITTEFYSFLDEVEMLPDTISDLSMDSVALALQFLRDELPDYPPPPGRGAPSPLRTAKQRRWFFWALREGKVQLPYQRTGELAANRPIELQRTRDGVIGELALEQTYAAWVVGQPEEQALIHQGRWWSFDDEIDENRERALEVLYDDLWERVKVAWV